MAKLETKSAKRPNAMNAAMVAGIGFLGCQIDSVLGAVLENRGFLTKGSVNAISIISGVLLMWLYLGQPM